MPRFPCVLFEVGRITFLSSDHNKLARQFGKFPPAGIIMNTFFPKGTLISNISLSLYRCYSPTKMLYFASE